MLTIRLARTGAKKRPFFHITVADSRRARDGKFIERVGYFNPIACGKEVRLDIRYERVDYWISQGAQLSEKVASLIKEDRSSDEEKSIRLKRKEKKRLRNVLKRKEEKESGSKTGTKLTEEAAPAEEAQPEEAAPAEESKSEDK